MHLSCTKIIIIALRISVIISIFYRFFFFYLRFYFLFYHYSSSCSYYYCCWCLLLVPYSASIVLFASSRGGYVTRTRSSRRYSMVEFGPYRRIQNVSHALELWRLHPPPMLHSWGRVDTLGVNGGGGNVNTGQQLKTA